MPAPRRRHPRLLFLAVAQVGIGWLLGGPRSAAIGLIYFALGWLTSTYIHRAWPWKFQ